MAIVSDWMTAAAHAIQGATENNREIISELCPFKEGVAYMPVPRCDQCKWWDKHTEHGGGWGACDQNRLASLTGREPLIAGVALDDDGAGIVTQASFGCVQWEAK